MDLKNLLSISGKPGLYKNIGQNKNSIIVESLIDGKKMPIYTADKISSLEDISIYTYDADVPLVEVFQNIWNKENGGPAINHKSDSSELKSYFSEVLADYDEDRVYVSDIKKIFNWYNCLLETGNLSELEDTTPEAGDTEDQGEDS